MRVTDIAFCVGQELKIRVRPDINSASFAVNVGHDSDNIALHFNPRFESGGDTNVIVMNHCSGGSWGQEERDSSFPFARDEECKFHINFTNDYFYIKLSDGSTMSFPNRLGDVKYSQVDVTGDATISGFKIK